MSVSLSRVRLGMAEQLADDVEAVSACRSHGSKRMPEVVKANVVEPGKATNVFPVLLNADERTVADNACLEVLKIDGHDLSFWF